MNNSKITEREYNKLIRRLEFFDTTRNNLLTFSFTAVLTILGIAFSAEFDEKSVWLCLLPFCLIIPFSARISYYRLASAHISSFLRQFSGKNMKFEIGACIVREERCKRYKLIAWLVNHEMVLLGIASAVIFYVKYVTVIESRTIFFYIIMFIPTALVVLTFLLMNATYNYRSLIDDFTYEWEKYGGCDNA